ncbi:uncharacterized protein LOC133516863 [Cydia pomonella]|uniref:uncharacterized protein LOC133516863 n=1 Tax=Cydia pomonella TaxID=82600 RepID=UPI002ADD6DFD|nr:uncharacterized protein LOC133516863 [Cydia pomonella]
MSTARMERAGRRSKAGSLSGLSGGLASTPGAGVRRQRSLEWGGDRYSSSDDDRPPQPPPLADRVFASLLAQATQQFDNEQRRIYGSECGEEPPRYVSSPQRQASPFPHESTGRRYFRRNRNSKGDELFAAEANGTLSRRGRRSEDFAHDNNARHQLDNGATNAATERECDSPPEPAPPEVPPRGPSLHVTLRHRPVPSDQPVEPDRLYLSEEFVMSEGGHGAAAFPARSPMSSSTTGHSSSSHHRFVELQPFFFLEFHTKKVHVV